MLAASGAGTTAVTALDATAGAALQNITTTTVTAAASIDDGETVSFTGNLGKAAVTLTGTNGTDDIFNVDGATMGTATFSVGSNAILQGTAAKLTGVTASGAGTTAVTALDATAGAALQNITTTTVTAAASIDDGETVSFTGNLGKAAVTLTGTNGTDDIFNVDGAAMGTATFSVDANAILQGTAAKLTGVMATGEGTTVVTALDDTLGALLQNIATTSVTSAVSIDDGETLNFTGNLGKTAVTLTGTNGTDDIFNVDGATMGTSSFSVDANAILQGTAAKLTGITVTGAGKTEITALHSTLGADLRDIDTNTTTAAFDGNGTFTGTLDGAVVTVGNGFTMTLAAIKATGETITGDGAVIVTGIDGSTNLSNVNPNGGVTASIANSADISGSSNLGNVDNFTFVSGADARMTIAQHAKVNAAAGDNTVTLNDAGTATAFTGVETYNLADGANTFTMANSGQTVVGGSGVDQITGGTGIDNITGGASDDVISAGLGADVITGGTGNDTMTGGDGADRFVFASGDTSSTVADEKILDFTTGSDELDFGEAAGDVTIVDGSLMVVSTFLTNAGNAFDGGLDVYIAYNISGINDALVAVDHNKDGSWGAGDTLIKLSGLNEEADILSTDITTY